MARFLDTGAGRVFYGDQAVLLTTPVPLTYACFYKPTAAATATAPLMMRTFSAGAGWTMLQANSSNVVQAYEYDGTNVGYAVSATTLVANEWNHCAAVFPSHSDRSAYHNGVIGTLISGVTVAPAAPDRFYVAAMVFNGGSVLRCPPGDFAELAIYTAALTADEIKALSRRVSPLLVRPQSLLAYWPVLDGTDADLIVRDRWRSSIDLTINAVVPRTAHPAMINPWHTTVGVKSNAAKFSALSSLRVSAAAALTAPVPLQATASFGVSTLALLIGGAPLLAAPSLRVATNAALESTAFFAANAGIGIGTAAAFDPLVLPLGSIYGSQANGFLIQPESNP